MIEDNISSNLDQRTKGGLNDSYNYNSSSVDTRFRSLGRDNENDDSTDRIVANYDKRFADYLVRMHNTLRADRIDVDEIRNLNETLEHIKHEQDKDYLNTLLYPETSKGSKIPSVMPVPSSSFQMHQSTIISTNSSGHASVIYNPFFLDNTGTYSTIYVNNNAALTGNASSNYFTSTSLGQSIPAVYNEYRLVSASIVVKYVGRLDIVQGVIGGAIVFDANVGKTATGSINANLAKYGDFNLAMDAYYTQENLALNGMRCLYFPLDTTFEQYQLINQEKSGFAMQVYIYGGVPSAAAYKIDVYANYECLADVSFLHYIPTAPCFSSEDKQAAVTAVQRRPITDDSEMKSPGKAKNRFWDDLKGSVGRYIPGIASIIGAIYPPAKGIAALINAGGEIISNKPQSKSFLPGLFK